MLLPSEHWLPDGDLTSIARIVTSSNDQNQLIADAHDHILLGYPSIAQTLQNLEGHSWEGKATDVEQYVKCCPKCQWFKIW